MASLSSASSSSRGGGHRRRVGSMAPKRSPVPYREDPMAYEPPKHCSHYGRKVPRWISWSSANPGRRYYSCVNGGPGCGFVDWHDAATTPFLRQLLGDLRDKVWDLESALANVSAGGDVAVSRDELEMKNAEISVIGANCEGKDVVLMYKHIMYALVIFLSSLVAGLMLA